jgi:hypothetical protein
VASGASEELRVYDGDAANSTYELEADREDGALLVVVLDAAPVPVLVFPADLGPDDLGPTAERFELAPDRVSRCGRSG